MTLTGPQQDEIKREFARRRRNQIVLIAPMLLAVVALASSENGLFGVPYAVAGPACFLVVLAGAIYSVFNWRCPACSKSLGKGLGPNFCAKCGVALR